MQKHEPNTTTMFWGLGIVGVALLCYPQAFIRSDTVMTIVCVMTTTCTYPTHKTQVQTHATIKQSYAIIVTCVLAPVTFYLCSVCREPPCDFVFIEPRHIQYREKTTKTYVHPALFQPPQNIFFLGCSGTAACAYRASRLVVL